jgi:phage-related protein
MTVFGNSGQNISDSKLGFSHFGIKAKKTKTLVLATNGFIKKTSKTPQNEIERAERIRSRYFTDKENNK